MKIAEEIYLTWRRGLGKRRIPIGVLKQISEEVVQFNYLPNQVKLAENEGFTLLLNFPDIDKTYEKNVLTVFSQRVVKAERNDLKEYFDFWKVDATKKNDVFYMLAKTQGLTPTDNFEFLANFHPIEGLHFVSEIAGLSKYELDSSILKEKDDLRFELEPLNEFDEKAVKLFKKEVFVGYVKLIHSRIFYQKDFNFDVRVQQKEANGRLRRVFIEIFLKK